MIDIPYATERRRDTGVNNVTLGIWLFLASEVMLFGGLFSAYFTLRHGGGAWRPDALHATTAAALTVPLLLAGWAIARAVRTSRDGRLTPARHWLWTASALAAVFVAGTLAEYSALSAQGATPAASPFFAVYYLLTGVHLLHVAGGFAVSVWVAAGRTVSPPCLANRLSATALYWYFVDLMWLIIAAALFL